MKGISLVISSIILTATALALSLMLFGFFTSLEHNLNYKQMVLDIIGDLKTKVIVSKLYENYNDTSDTITYILSLRGIDGEKHGVYIGFVIGHKLGNEIIVDKDVFSSNNCFVGKLVPNQEYVYTNKPLNKSMDVDLERIMINYDLSFSSNNVSRIKLYYIGIEPIPYVSYSETLINITILHPDETIHLSGNDHLYLLIFKLINNKYYLVRELILSE